ncbi:hypothetical protein [Halocatena marina]|uniref:Uncharacterized protein n=1 Tax=Halocatena marina TaxID=2934937 RepID=A0ABD5YQ49_9EURY|nr:hypothetical protein [Halocatena marina]
MAVAAVSIGLSILDSTTTIVHPISIAGITDDPNALEAIPTEGRS